MEGLVVALFITIVIAINHVNEVTKFIKVQHAISIFVGIVESSLHVSLIFCRRGKFTRYIVGVSNTINDLIKSKYAVTISVEPIYEIFCSWWLFAIVIIGGFQQLRKFVETQQVVPVGIAAVEPPSVGVLILAGHRRLPVLFPLTVEVIEEFLHAQIAVVVRVHVVHHLLWVWIVTTAAQHGPDAVDEALHLVDVDQVVAVIVAIIEQSCNLFRIEFGVRWVGLPKILELLGGHVAVAIRICRIHGLFGGRGAIVVIA